MKNNMKTYSMKFAKKRAMNKIEFKKMYDTFLDSMPLLKSHRQSLVYTCIYWVSHKILFILINVPVKLFTTVLHLSIFDKRSLIYIIERIKWEFNLDLTRLIVILSSHKGSILQNSIYRIGIYLFIFKWNTLFIKSL